LLSQASQELSALPLDVGTEAICSQLATHWVAGVLPSGSATRPPVGSTIVALRGWGVWERWVSAFYSPLASSSRGSRYAVGVPLPEHRKPTRAWDLQRDCWTRSN